MGSGPAVLLVHGAMLSAASFMKLSTALSDEFEVLVPDRRGRGHSGPHGGRYCALREVEDLQAIAAVSGASRIFGLSSGALVALYTALHTPTLTRLGLYDPPLSCDGSAPMAWIPRYDREITAGRTGAALITALKGLGVEPVLDHIPRFALTPLLTVAQRLQKADADEIPITELVRARRAGASTPAPSARHLRRPRPLRPRRLRRPAPHCPRSTPLLPLRATGPGASGDGGTGGCSLRAGEELQPDVVGVAEGD
ncbi:MAG: alpha/beta hydrolase, partial [Pseudonocardia sp.]|nr:alpha/beta hydrolase [Pseudonocardia sp.]